MVPWVWKQKKEKVARRPPKSELAQEKAMGAEKGSHDSGDKTFLRYYHLYRKGELERDVEEAGGIVLEAGYEKDNWWVVACLK